MSSSLHLGSDEAGRSSVPQTISRPTLVINTAETMGEGTMSPQSPETGSSSSGALQPDVNPLYGSHIPGLYVSDSEVTADTPLAIVLPQSAVRFPGIPMSPPVTPRHINLDALKAANIAPYEVVYDSDAKFILVRLHNPVSLEEEIMRGDAFRGVLEFPKLVPMEFLGFLQPDGFNNHGGEVYGHGTWSTVRRAVWELPPTAKEPIYSRPGHFSSPATPKHQDFGPMVVAVKVPSSANYKPLLRDEARILTFLHLPVRLGSSSADRYVVPFFGMEEPTGAMVMEAIPLTLAEFSAERGALAKVNFSTRTMRDPVIGADQWLQLASDLVAGLEFLQSNSVVHGDIKPANILLRPTSIPDDTVASAALATRPYYQPVYCDFSSSHVLDPYNSPDPISAITTEYTAPELLEAFHGESGLVPVATYASDIYALGATLIFPATGEEIFPRALSMQKLAFAREGVPLESARRGDQASRILKGGMVDRMLVGAVQKVMGERWVTREWKAMLAREIRHVKQAREKGN
ncbi:MAG: hypothetical protein M4579_006310 [Chaenotheca gracillima]|nr:MAG: hypothetical protein M4579_006310 [Chaenotheca gracillima]